MDARLLKTKSNAVEGRVVTVAVNAFGNMDSQGDISVQGSFTKTLKENFGRIKHFLNHDTDKLIGCPLEGREENGYLVMVSEMANTQLANDVLELYKLYDKNKRTLEHSIGVEAMQRDKENPSKVLQWKLWEYSTLYSWGANEKTPLLGIKREDLLHFPKKSLDFVKQALDMKFSDHVLIAADELRKLIEKATNGQAGLIECECGKTFDYFAQPEISVDKEVLRIYNDTLRWMFYDAAREQAWDQYPDIQEEVIELLNNRQDKSLISELSYVICPYCGKLHYRNEIITIEEKSHVQPVAKPSDDTSHVAPKGVTFAAIGNMLSK
jgi:HK97 family phage prohead protease